MTEYSNNTWETKKCGRCGEPHSGYSGKLDKDGLEYVVCGITNKRMNVAKTGRIKDCLMYPTIWQKEYKRRLK